MSRSPSRWRHRALLGALALAGACVATYLTFVQTGVVASAWDPYFGPGSDRVLRSALSAALPVPDALAGAVLYVVELGLDLAGGADRYRRWPGLVLTFGALTALMALVSVALVLLQAFVVHAWCTLCLTSATLSWLIFLLALPESLAAWRVHAGLPPAQRRGDKWSPGPSAHGFRSLLRH